MEETRFRTILEAELAPLLQGTVAASSEPSTNQEHLTSYDNPCRLLAKPIRDAGYRVPIERSQAFTSQERQLAGQFIDELSRVANMGAGEYEAELLRAIPRRVVATHLGGGGLLRAILEHLEDWSSQTYEGQRIVASFGLDPTPATTGIPLDDLWNESFGPVMSNGYDTLIVVGNDGNVREMLQLSTGHVSSTAPLRLGEVACWATDDRISVVLNRHGEILVFKNASLRFARRSGKWLHYVHETNIRRMSPPRHRELREAVYESCLDVSFARSGGCIGIFEQGHMGEVGALVDGADLLVPAQSYKAKLIAAAVQGRPFHDLDRRLRLELLSMDGAVVLDRYGKVLAAGAIIEVPAGSADGGGRRAAARKLSTVGLGLKISEDGTISGFRNSDEILVS